MAGAQIATSLTIVNNMLGFQAISLTNFATSAQSLIAAGSKVEVGGSFFTFAGNDTPQASTFTAITTGETAYITLTPSGSAGSQILTSMYSDTAPEWSDSKQGWYLTAASVIRYIGGVYKESATQYERAFLLTAEQNQAPTPLSPKILEIGTWNMDTTGSVGIAHGLSDHENIKTVSILIRQDGMLNTRPLDYSPGVGAVAGYWNVDTTNVNLFRIEDGTFDGAQFDTMGGDGNRGWIVLELGP